MTFFRLLLRNLSFTRRRQLRRLARHHPGQRGVDGASLVGDSLRGSLQDLTLNQLAWVEDAMLPGRFFLRRSRR